MRIRNNIRLDEIKLNNKGCGGSVENPPAPDSASPDDAIAATADPLRNIVMWAASVDDGLLDATDTDLLWKFIASARTEIKANFVPLALAIEMARPKPEFGAEPPDMGSNATTGGNAPNSGQSVAGGGS